MGNDYIYSSAFTRSKEKNLIKYSQFVSLASSEGLSETFGRIKEAGYAGEGTEITVSNFDNVLTNAWENISAEIKELAEQGSLIEILSMKSDFHNVKTMIKAEISHKDYENILLKDGNYPVNVIEDAVQSRSSRFVDDKLFSAIKESVELLARTNDPGLVDVCCDRYCMESMLEQAVKSGNDFIIGYVKLLIDTINLKTFLRMKQNSRQINIYHNAFINGGNLDIAMFNRGYELDNASFASLFNGSLLDEVITSGRDYLTTTSDYTLVEKLCDNAIIKYIKKAKSISFGPEVLFAFLVAKQMEIKNIKIIIAGKMAKLEPEKIIERIRDTYE